MGRGYGSSQFEKRYILDGWSYYTISFPLSLQRMSLKYGPGRPPDVGWSSVNLIIFYHLSNSRWFSQRDHPVIVVNITCEYVSWPFSTICSRFLVTALASRNHQAAALHSPAWPDLPLVWLLLLVITWVPTLTGCRSIFGPDPWRAKNLCSAVSSYSAGDIGIAR